MRDYISETIKEAGEKLIENDKLVLPVSKLKQRITWWKNFINKNANFTLISECKLTYNFYLSTLLHGIENTVTKTADANSNYYKLAKIFKGQ